MFIAIPRVPGRMFPCAPSSDQVVLRVRDYGKGMPREVLERFHQNRAPGGVGLAGMRERIHELGGQLEMDSDGPWHPGSGDNATVETKAGSRSLGRLMFHVGRTLLSAAFEVVS